MIHSSKALPTKNLQQMRYLFILITLVCLLFLYYASNSIYFKATVFGSYNNINSIQIRELDTSSNLNSSSFKTSVLNVLTNSKISAQFNESENQIITQPNNITEICPLIPPNLGTRIQINMTALPIEEIEKSKPFEAFDIQQGGKSAPKTCKALFKVAIIIPYRDRLENLKLFLNHMHPFLNKQQLEYGIYLVEPEADIKFNRGLLMNIGFAEAIKDETKWECFIFHDVDLLPEDERNIYSCPEVPRHMSSSVSTHNYKLLYDAIFGGVTAFQLDHYKKINGFSNLFFGWGGEDDDLRNRVNEVGLKVIRYPLEIGRYYMANHKKDTPNPDRYKYLNAGASRLAKDGISTLKYDVKAIEKNKLYTKIIVSYNKDEIINTLKL